MNVLRVKRIAVILCVSVVFGGAVCRGYGYPSDPKNAALLYYQAFMCEPKADSDMAKKLGEFALGRISANDSLIAHIGSCSRSIDLAASAAELADCDWGLQYSQGFSMLLGHLGQMRALAKVVIADSRLLASQGKYEDAFGRCRTAYLMSRHAGDDTLVSYLVARAIEEMAHGFARDNIGIVSNDSAFLNRFKCDLSALSKIALSFRNTLKIEREVALEQMRLDTIHGLMAAINSDKSSEELAKELENLGGEAFLEKSRRYYKDYMESLDEVLGRGMSYSQTWAELDKLAKKLDSDKEKAPEALLTSMVAPSLTSIYSTDVRAQAAFNAVAAGVEICLEKARTGKLPDELPAGVAKDPFSGEDFEYKKTKAGFLLRCRGKDLSKKKIHEFAFTVAK
ncbi:MAG: hypothetical protein JW720_11695 [Sedimentisphaerales bacterium]|nr:hypothetical protein [Sedimentisphaerales bacterium]